jgi:hypothetical protein
MSLRRERALKGIKQKQNILASAAEAHQSYAPDLPFQRAKSSAYFNARLQQAVSNSRVVHTVWDAYGIQCPQAVLGRDEHLETHGLDACD